MNADTTHTTADIYAVYLPNSTAPDYIGSHATTPPTRSSAAEWRYANGRYIGQGFWIDPQSGAIICHPGPANARTIWGSAVLAMSPAKRAALRVVTLATVPAAERWRTEAQLLRLHRPRFNPLLPMPAQQAREKRNAYMRHYLAEYRRNNPDKVAAKRIADRERARRKRAATKKAKEQTSNAGNVA